MPKTEKTENGAPKGRPKAAPGTFGRIIKLLFSYYPGLVPLTIFCILFSSAVSAIPSIFVQKVITSIQNWYLSGDWEAAKGEIISEVLILISLYLLSVIAIAVYTQLMAYITQGFLCKLRRSMFDGMQDLPIKYFDTHKHGDIMSYYTNDIDTLRRSSRRRFPR